jgi:heme-degrading monooxygenase HmoA
VRSEEVVVVMTVVTNVVLREGEEPAWDEAMRDRLEAARARPGWIAAQILIPLDAPDRRTIIGTWESRADWEAWHTDAFKATRERLEELEAEPGEPIWYEVTVHLHRE